MCLALVVAPGYLLVCPRVWPAGTVGDVASRMPRALGAPAGIPGD